MSPKEQGKLLRAWRKWEAARRQKRLTLMTLAAEVAERAEAKGFAPTSRKIPGSHASMTRWENGAPQSLEGLTVIAEIYGVSIVDLMKDPPPATEDKPDEAAVDAFRAFLASQRT